MDKKILLLLFLLAFAVFLPATKVDAATAHVYVGVQVIAASAPGYNSVIDSNWCLPVGTQINVLGAPCTATSSGSSYTGTCSAIAAVSNSGTNTGNTTLSPSCASGNIIWSGLLNLTTSTNYVIQLYTPSFCPGVVSAYCYVTAGANKNCTDTCAAYGLTPNSTSCYNYNSYTDCSMIQSLAGVACNAAGVNCFGVSGTAGYNNYDSNTGYCYYTSSGGTPPNCNAGGATIIRACNCNYTSGGSYFYFTFNASSF